jgi:hypothetical protein
MGISDQGPVIRDQGSGVSESETSSEGDAPHETSLAVWDLISPIIIGRRATLKVGVACRSGCNLSGVSVDVYNEAGARVGGGTLGPAPWPATAALYWVELDLAAPEREGDLLLEIHATPTLPHADATSVVTFVVSRPPEHRVTLRVIDKTSGAPLAGVELRLGRFRAATDAGGLAYFEVPGDTYDVGTWKTGYEVIAQTVAIERDTTIRLELTAASHPEQPYWM